MYDDPIRNEPMPLGRSRINEAESTMMAGIVTFALFVAAIVALAFLVWPRGSTTTGTAVTENMRKVERSAPATPRVPTPPQ
jgi:hypothetical protein